MPAIHVARSASYSSNGPCPYEHPEMNTDISGPGVRISFYLQAYFLSLLSARSGSLDEISGALYTLIATNVAMVVASSILGFKSEPTMSLQDAVVVLYLLSLSWIAIFTSMPAYNRFIRSDKVLQIVSILQSYIVLAFVLVVLIKAPNFGSCTCTNAYAVAVIFKQFAILDTGRFAAFVVLVIVFIVSTVLNFTDYRRPIMRFYRQVKRRYGEHVHFGRKPQRRMTTARLRTISMHVEKCQDGSIVDFRRDSASPATHISRPARFNGHGSKRQKGPKEAHYHGGISGTLLVELTVISILWALSVVNTELLVRNNFGPPDGSDPDIWEFGQILPMFLIGLPLVNLIKVYRKFGLVRRTHRRRVHKSRRRAFRQAARSTDPRAGKEVRRKGHAQTSGGPLEDGDTLFFPPSKSLPPGIRRFAGENGTTSHISVFSISASKDIESGRGVPRRCDSTQSASSVMGCSCQK